MAELQEPALTEELSIMKAIYADDLEIKSHSPTRTAISVRLESQPFSFSSLSPQPILSKLQISRE